MGAYVQPRTKGQGQGSTTREFYARKNLVARIMKIGEWSKKEGPMPKKRPGKYPGSMQSVPLKIPNVPRDAFRAELENIPFLGYEVEQVKDGRRICITKPGGKSPWGRMQVHDFMVWVYDAAAKSRWRISHDEIYEDIAAKLGANPTEAKRVVLALSRVHAGEEPDAVLASRTMAGLGAGFPGEPPDLILKAYKWIFGQEDINYPTGEGRDMAMSRIRELVSKVAK